MLVARGNEVYNADAPPVIARGLTLDQAELAAARFDRLPSILSDATGRGDLESFCRGLELTQFGQENVAEALRAMPEEEHSRGWREGEALAEAWLTDHQDCYFPWPFNRDLRHYRASLPGAELVGFTGADAEARFAFGQVKTSKEAQHPPQVVSRGAKSLINQVLQLRDNKSLKNTVVKYLLHRAMREDGLVAQARAAATRWLQSNFMEIVIFGILVRDVDWSARDLADAAIRLRQGCDPATRIAFYGLYLPANSISEGPQHRTRQGGRR